MLMLHLCTGDVIGRPVLTACVDAYSGLCCGYSLSWEQDHPLWQARNLVLTPHISGNMSLGYTRDRAVEIFCENLTRYAAGEPLHHLVDRSRGY